MSLSKIFSQSWKILGTHASLIFTAVLVVCLPFNALVSLLAVQAPDPSVEPGVVFQAVAALSGLLNFIFATLVFSIAVNLLTEASRKGLSLSSGEMIRKALGRLPAVLWTAFLQSLFLIPLYFALIIPGFIFSVFWVFSLQTAALRDKAGIPALSYSKALVRGRWWKTWGYFLAVVLVGALILFAAQFIGGLLVALFKMTGLPLVVVALLNSVTMTAADFVGAFYSAAMTYFFLQWEETPPSAVSPAASSNL